VRGRYEFAYTIKAFNLKVDTTPHRYPNNFQLPIRTRPSQLTTPAKLPYTNNPTAYHPPNLIKHPIHPQRQPYGLGSVRFRDCRR
jgi:hypothetical protein